ncbi:helix-hairpin-helix domain-containing protein [Velocimicrobium porci]|uniref:Helix-hairpin-helix DNA-binding motif class 1 domain-containing protein n=1 Tax=Velocimicrobium porci TaxID=2606634 RepID=A0A6L5Y081_9FIRM|nr:helix-hairpin-helix domain-containing protein [Velocimicrobium porci]MSS64465.1 hypothetical protein [Velocimicrobium porci]
MKQKRIFIAVTVLLILIAGLYYSIGYRAEGEEELFSAEDLSLENPGELDNKQDNKTEEICIYICGQVKKAGVYYLQENCRVADVIEAAGGFKKGAAKEQVNLAKKLSDGEKVYIPSKKETDSAEETENDRQDREHTSVEEVQKMKINLNEASESALMTLPGIGKSKAAAIIRYRTEYGFFKEIEEIKKIEGIKDGVFQKIKDYITI